MFYAALQAPHAMCMRAGIKMGDASMVDTCIKDGLMDAFYNYHMGITGKTGSTSSLLRGHP